MGRKKDRKWEAFHPTTVCLIKGREHLLKKEITKPLLLTEEIQQRQEALKELSELTNFRQIFYAKGKLLKESEEDIKKISQIVSYKPILLAKHTYYKIMRKNNGKTKEKIKKEK